MSLIWNILNGLPDQADKRSEDWFLMSSPWPVIIIIYLYVKLVKNWGPKWMENRQPFQIDRLVQIFDVCQIVINAYLFYEALFAGWLHYNWRCEPVDYSDSPHALKVAGLVHVYFVVKITDLLDTVFFVLRKKQNQVSFLHVYHHASMVISTWMGVRFFPGGHITFLGLLNSFIHAVMYTHYFVMSLKIWQPWWKKYLTQMQIIQFFMVLYHFSQLLWVPDCGFPKYLTAIFVPQNLFMIYMFSKFYYNTYIKIPEKTQNCKHKSLD